MKYRIVIINTLGRFESDVKDLSEDEIEPFENFVSKIIKSSDINYLSINMKGNEVIFKGASIKDAIVKIEKIKD